MTAGAKLQAVGNLGNGFIGHGKILLCLLHPNVLDIPADGQAHFLAELPGQVVFGVARSVGEFFQVQRFFGMKLDVVNAGLDVAGYLGIAAVFVHTLDKVLIHGVVQGGNFCHIPACNHALNVMVAHTVGGMSEEEILQGCQKKGGLLGISGVSNDLRYVIEAADAGNARAKLAVDVFVTGIVHYIGSFFMDLGGLTDLVYTAGIGEHSDRVRAMVCEKLGAIGVKLDEEANKKNASIISAPDSAVTVRVIPTDEELGIARRTFELV